MEYERLSVPKLFQSDLSHTPGYLFNNIGKSCVTKRKKQVGNKLNPAQKNFIMKNNDSNDSETENKQKEEIRRINLLVSMIALFMILLILMIMFM
ncbi:Hypothetical protein IALB_2309 [Ignavibacterium album JCM 16511]|uniref:Uncharacterized protein n=1 Tax=Ignavibacterium album (strain DSM 19864 / JCM 16511 / NBRC 101810 / Mat9-16) TaxID=945713 RepID=I0AM05_IGNAJ|nr:hypothetical protein [Ignavibacterium album]AFH50012.1 Hypothetical protein IALB_2309 [Ignavibacterium album JCM 16511]